MSKKTTVGENKHIFMYFIHFQSVKMLANSDACFFGYWNFSMTNAKTDNEKN